MSIEGEAGLISKVKNARRSADVSSILPSSLTRFVDNGQLKLEMSPDSFEKGDLTVDYIMGKLRLAWATGEEIGRQPLFSLGSGDNIRMPLPFRRNYRVRRQIPFDVPERRALLPKRVKLTPLLSEEEMQSPLSTYTDTSDYSVLGAEGCAPIGDLVKRRTALKEIASLAEIDFSDPNGLLSNDYLLRGKGGIPIIISDFHQKQAPHLLQLIKLRLLPNIKPIIDWVDQHFDERTTRKDFFHNTTIASLNEAIAACNRVDSGMAAALLHYSHLANIHYFPTLALYDGYFAPPPAWGEKINAFDYVNPFARPTNQPHLLSFDTDQLPAFCDTKDGGIFENTSAANYQQWLQQGGMNVDNYDAVFIYASPGYVTCNHKPSVFLPQAIRFIALLFMD